MHVRSLRLRDYRNYTSLDLCFQEGVNIIIGPNAQGKTNLLESIFFLATGTSHRAGRDAELVRWSADSFQIKGEIFSQRRYHDIHIKFSGNRKNIAIDGTQLGRVSDLLGITNVVLFSPDDLQLVKGSPGLRRRFLNISICRVSPSYRANLIEYEKILSQRNNLLRSQSWEWEKGFDEHLSVWNEGLIKTGTEVILKRAEALEKLSDYAAPIHKNITAGHEKMKINYELSFKVKSFSREDVSQAFARDLALKKEDEIRRKVTLLGPHRDDFNIAINSIDARVFGSQGQQRTCVLSLKLAEMEYLNEEAGEYPILLLDDVMSELDKSRRTYLMESLGSDIQTIITTTELDNIMEGVDRRWKVFKFRDGILIEDITPEERYGDAEGYPKHIDD